MADKTENTPKTEDKPKKVFIPAGGRPSPLPTVPAGVEWDTVTVGDYEFVYLAAGNLQGIRVICNANEKVAAGLFNRATRIAIPARTDARKRLNESKDKTATAAELQAEFLAIDLSKVAERAPRQPKEVALPAGQKTFSAAEVAEMLKNAGIKVTQA